MKKQLLITTLSLLSLGSFAQLEANHWHFAENLGLDFTNGAPVLTNTNAMNTPNGSASYSNEYGTLYFYTDGETVYDANNNVMPNGSGLKGFNMSNQPALIVPGSVNKYYIFHGDADNIDEDNNRHGYQNDSVFSYSVVSMSQNGGLGDVVEKNTVLTAPINGGIAGVAHANTKDNWVMTYNVKESAFYAYSVGATGISVPVISPVDTFGNNAKSAPIKFSPDGKHVVVYFYNDAEHGIYVFDFDDATGEVSNPKWITAWGYGYSFSPNSKYLYVSYQGSVLEQYDITAGDELAIQLSKEVIAGDYGPYVSYYGLNIQNAPDGKMYVAKDKGEWYPGTTRGTYLGVINEPNQKGAACDYADKGVYLDGKFSGYNFPNFIESYFKTNTTSTVSSDEYRVSSEGLSVFPNPSSGKFEVSTPLDLTGEIVAFNAIGQEVERTTINAQQTTIDMSHLEKGIYFLQVAGKDEVERLIIK